MLNRITHIILAFLLFISTSGFTVNQHFCQNQLKDVQIFCQPKSCHTSDQTTIPTCHKKAKSCQHHSKENQKGCCENKSELVQLDIDQAATVTDFAEFDASVLVAFFITFSVFDLPTGDQKTFQTQHYRPPPIVTDYTAELQTFLL